MYYLLLSILDGVKEIPLTYPNDTHTVIGNVKYLVVFGTAVIGHWHRMRQLCRRLAATRAGVVRIHCQQSQHHRQRHCNGHFLPISRPPTATADIKCLLVRDQINLRFLLSHPDNLCITVLISLWSCCCEMEGFPGSPLLDCTSFCHSNSWYCSWRWPWHRCSSSHCYWSWTGRLTPPALQRCF